MPSRCTTSEEYEAPTEPMDVDETQFHICRKDENYSASHDIRRTSRQGQFSGSILLVLVSLIDGNSCRKCRPFYLPALNPINWISI